MLEPHFGIAILASRGLVVELDRLRRWSLAKNNRLFIEHHLSTQSRLIFLIDITHLALVIQGGHLAKVAPILVRLNIICIGIFEIVFKLVTHPVRKPRPIPVID